MKDIFGYEVKEGDFCMLNNSNWSGFNVRKILKISEENSRFYHEKLNGKNRTYSHIRGSNLIKLFPEDRLYQEFVKFYGN
jgi:hypothetical protein